MRPIKTSSMLRLLLLALVRTLGATNNCRKVDKERHTKDDSVLDIYGVQFFGHTAKLKETVTQQLCKTEALGECLGMSLLQNAKRYAP